MMGEIESIRMSEVVVPTKKSKEMVALAVASMNASMGIHRAKECSGE